MLNKDEKIVLDLRPHWWVIFPASFALGFAVVLGLAAVVTDWPTAVDVLIGIVVLVALGYFLNKFVRWNSENFVVTNKRVISRSGVVAKAGMEIPLDRINTVIFRQSLFERILGAGDLTVESAGEGGQQEFSGVRKPNLVQQEIYRQMEADEARGFTQMGQATAAAFNAGQQGPSIPEQIEQLDNLRRQGALTDAEFEAKKRDLLDRL